MTVLNLQNEINDKDFNRLGGKSQSLYKLISHGFRVPETFTITSSWSENILAETFESDLYKDYVELDISDYQKIEDFSQKLIIITTKILEKYSLETEVDGLNLDPKRLYAVRSSANCEDGVENSFAGQFDSFLNVEIKDIGISVKKCILSLFSPRVIFYLKTNQLSLRNLTMAIIIQEMIPSEVAGVMFTRHPLSQNLSQIYIEAVYGLGEGIVSGKYNTDSYLVDKNSLEILHIEVSQQTKYISPVTNTEMEISPILQEIPKLLKKEIIELADLGKKIEKIYDNISVDIEWSLFENQLYILQARPITI